MPTNKQITAASINKQLTSLSNTITSEATISEILTTIHLLNDIQSHLDIIQHEAILSITQTLIAENFTHYLQPDIDQLTADYL